jgi:hypothetical protein
LLNVMLLLFGLAAILVAIGLLTVFARLNRTLRAVETLVLLATEEVRDTLPEVRQSLGNVNDITAGVNVAMRSAGNSIGQVGGRLRRSLSAAAYGAKVAGQSLRAADAAPGFKEDEESGTGL